MLMIQDTLVFSLVGQGMFSIFHDYSNVQSRVFGGGYMLSGEENSLPSFLMAVFLLKSSMGIRLY